MPVGVEALEVDAVAEQMQLGSRDADAGERLDVLGVLDELRVGARGREALERRRRAPASTSASSGNA